jgi:hypothetical protein
LKNKKKEGKEKFISQTDNMHGMPKRTKRKNDREERPSLIPISKDENTTEPVWSREFDYYDLHGADYECC